MRNMRSKYDNMHRNGILKALISLNNHVITSISYMLSTISVYEVVKMASRVDTSTPLIPRVNDIYTRYLQTLKTPTKVEVLSILICFLALS